MSFTDHRQRAKDRRVREWTLVCVLLLALISLAGCADTTLRVESGEYALSRATGDLESLDQSVASITVDVQASTAVFAMHNGSQITVDLSARDADTWPSGCPTNINSYRMEVYDVSPAPLILADAALEKPVLVRNCPDNPLRIVLREDGEIGGAVTACGESCVLFVDQSTGLD